MASASVELPVSAEEYAALGAAEKSDWVVTQYVYQQTLEAKNKVEREMHGQGCGCPSCLKYAASEINLWMEWLDPDGKFSRYKPALVNGGTLTIKEVTAREYYKAKT